MKRILVTGAGGFVGQYLVKRLEEDQEVVVTHKSGDLTDPEFANELVKEARPDLIYHLAAMSVVENSEAKGREVLATNTTLQYNILEAYRQFAPSSRLIAICSANEYGLVDESEIPLKESAPLRPLNPYAVSKVTQDMLALQYHLAYGLDIVRLRPFNHTGPGQSESFVIPRLAMQFAEIARGESEPVIEVGNLDSVRDFTDVRDMVEAYILAAKHCKSGEVYNVGYGKGITVREIISLFEEIAGVKVTLKRAEHKVRASDVPVLLSDSSKFRKISGWQPKYKLKETLSFVYNSIK